jgi:hypothetical protein
MIASLALVQNWQGNIEHAKVEPIRYDTLSTTTTTSCTTINYEKEITMIPSMEDKLNKDYEVRVTKDYSHVTEIDYKYS